MLVDVELFLVHDALDGRTQRDGSVDLGVFDDLVGRDLHQRRLFVLDRRGLHLDHRHGWNDLL